MNLDAEIYINRQVNGTLLLPMVRAAIGNVDVSDSEDEIDTALAKISVERNP